MKVVFNNQTTNPAKSWKEKVLSADDIWQQVEFVLSQNDVDLPQTLRRPDVRLIINNVTGRDVIFRNPGDHSNSKAEQISGTGDKRAVMVMLRGDNLEQQQTNAETLFVEYDLGNEGLSERFIKDLSARKLGFFVDEAYGPAPFEDQASRLSDVEWVSANNETSLIVPKRGEHAAFGARPATKEMVLLTTYDIYVQGTGTTPELVESDGMCIAVSKHWETGVISTRPIVPSVARGYYGRYFESIPVASLDPNGNLKSIDLAPNKPKQKHVKSKAPKMGKTG